MSPSQAAAASPPAPVDVQNVAQDTRRARLLTLFSLLLVGAAPWLLSSIAQGSLTGLSFLAAVACYLWSALSWAGADRGPGERKLKIGTVDIASDQITVTIGDTVHRLPLSGRMGGWIEHVPQGSIAILPFRDGRILAIGHPTEQAALEVLTRAGVGPAERAVRMRGYRESASGRQIAAFFLALFIPAFAYMVTVLLRVAPFLHDRVVYDLAAPIWSLDLSRSLNPFWSFMATTLSIVTGPLAIMIGWLWSKVLAKWIHIGTDGVIVRGTLRRRFFRHEDIANLEHIQGGIGDAYHFVKLSEKNGRSTTIPASNAEEANTMIARIFAARNVASAQDRARLLDGIARNGRPIDEWRKALSGVIPQTGYRTAGLDLETVVRIAEDPLAPSEQRVAAALAAQSHGGEVATRRIRVAAEACVEPKLRVALERAADGELEDDLLEEISAPKKRA